jgi:hypothetical protein
MNKPIFYKEKHVGDIINDVFVSERNWDRHYFKKFDSWGISCNVLDQLDRLGIEDILIICNYTTYLTNVATFLCNGTEYTDIDDKQLLLQLKYFKSEIPSEKPQIQVKL